MKRYSNSKIWQYRYLAASLIISISSIGITNGQASCTTAPTLLGPTTVCKGGTATYTIDPVTDPSLVRIEFFVTNASIITRSDFLITVSIPDNFTTGQVVSYGVFGCGAGPAATLTITGVSGTSPAAASTITGSGIASPDQSNVPYSIPSIPGADGYRWVLPFGASIGSGANTNSIGVNFSSSFAGGTISVSGSKGTCYGPASTLDVASSTCTTLTPGSISGSSSVCPGQTGVVYNIPAIAGASEYIWTLPGGQKQATPTNSITVNFSSNAASGALRVYARNSTCLVGPTASTNITVQLPALTITDPGALCAVQQTGVGFTASSSSGTNYQWYKNETPVTDNGPGVPAYAYAPQTLLNVGDRIKVTALMSNSCVTNQLVTSNVVTISTFPAVTPFITLATTPGPPVVLCAGDNFTFTGNPGGSYSLSNFTWALQRLVDGTYVRTPLSNNSSMYSTTSLGQGDYVEVTATASGSCLAGTSATGTTQGYPITVRPRVVPSVSLSLSTINICAGTSAAFTATPTNGGASPIYAWQINGAVATGSTNSATYTTSALQNNDVVKVIMTSNELCLTTTAPAERSTQPAVVTPYSTFSIDINSPGAMCSGIGGNFQATIVDGGNGTYRWYRTRAGVETQILDYERDLSSGYAYVFAPHPNYPLQNNDGIRCTFTSNRQCVTTNPISSTPQTVTIQQPVQPAITIGTSATLPLTICQGDQLTFTASPGSAGYTLSNLQWKLNDAIQVGNANTFSTTGYTQGGKVTVTATAIGSCITSSTPVPGTSEGWPITVKPRLTPSILMTPSAVNVCQGTSVTFTTTTSNGGGSPGYQWKVNGAIAPGNANSGSYTTTSLQNGDVVNVVMTSSETCLTTTTPVERSAQPAVVTAYSTFDLNIESQTPMCNGINGNFEASIVDGGNGTYRWYRTRAGVETQILDHERDLSSGYAYIFTPHPNYPLQNNDKIRCTFTSNRQCVTTNPVSTPLLSVVDRQPTYPAVVIGTPTSLPATVCEGDEMTFTASPANTDYVLHNFAWTQWRYGDGGYVATPLSNNSNTYSTTSFKQGDYFEVTATATGGCILPTPPISGTTQGWPILVKPIVEPPALQNKNLTRCNWEDISLDAGTYYDVKWYDVTNQLLGTDPILHVGKIFGTGSYTFRVTTETDEACFIGSTGIITVSVVSVCDDRLNWVENELVDENDATYSHARNYFDEAGRSLQSQTKLYSAPGGVKVLAAQNLRDRFDREVGSTLSAPVPYTNFNYHYGFVLGGSSALPYDYTNLDVGAKVSSPDPVINTVPGTVGWYYSANNTMESNVPVTNYPYSRTEYYEDGTGEVKRSGSPGDTHRLGMGHEPLSGTFPVYTELDDYLIRRRTQVGLPDRQTDNTFRNEAVQSVVKDENGNYAISIADKSGKGVLTGRKGGAGDFTLQITNTVISSLKTTSPNYRPMTYFYILDDQPITITGVGTNYTVEDIVSGTSYTPVSGSWKAGFYRILLTSDSITFTYTNYLTDVSCQFYDDAGRVKYSVSPNGYKKWTGTPATPSNPAIPPTPFSAIDKTTYEYNFQGWLLSIKEPDAGRTRYVYRKDGKIRFSQNAEQKNNNKFSYTHYDNLGRPVESGEYQGSELTFIPMDSTIFTGSAMQTQLDQTFDNVTWTGVRKDWVRTHYDLADQNFATVTSITTGYTQNFLSGGVSWTQNENTTTWYSYDERGRVVWMAQKPIPALNYVFVMKYDYDFLGNVMKVTNFTYLNGQQTEQFYHHYEYDLDKRLSKAYTSLNGTDKRLRATYKYYLHGPLKRIELADKLQGIDFVYNINGWLTQINHPNVASDPGHDGTSSGFREDAFGMTLDYYESTMTGLFPLSVDPMEINDPLRIHHLPKLEEPTIKESLAGTSGQQMKILLESMKRLRSESGVGNNVSTEN